MENGLTGAESGNCDFLRGINWTQPWLAPLHQIGAGLCQAGDQWRQAFNAAAARQGLCNHGGQPICLVPQRVMPAGAAYETWISATGQVPTRDNLHDFFNALIWLAWPAVKAQLNALQATEIARQQPAVAPAVAYPPTRHRGGLRDALTLFDENAAIMVSTDPDLFELLRSHSWNALFMAQRGAFGKQCEVLLCGHALLEKLIRPYKAITAHAWLVLVEADFFVLDCAEKRARLDSIVAASLDAGMRPSDLTPLPVLGVPAWSAGQTAAFYGDVGVFRPVRRRADR